MTSNPIRKQRTKQFDGLWHIGYWYAICPVCDEKLTAHHGRIIGSNGPNKGSRKEAKDLLYHHTQEIHAETRLVAR